MRHLPPIGRLALGVAGGIGIVFAGASGPLIAFVVVLALAPIGVSPRPAHHRTRAASLMLGVILGLSAHEDACAPPEPDTAADLLGMFLATPVEGAAPFRPVGSRCAELRVVTHAMDLPPAGVPVHVTGVWQVGRRAPWVLARSVTPSDSTRIGLRTWSVRWRQSLHDRIDRLYGPRAPLVAALLLARREGLDPEVRGAFARAGLAHLLAISGFHVGLMGGLVFALLRACGIPRRAAGLGAAAWSWAYVALIGFPDAAFRAALLITLMAVAHARGRPPARWGALAASFVILVMLNPSRMASPGFQLSFAGAGGLLAWGQSFTEIIDRWCRRRCPRALTSAIAAGAAATIATLPIVAWHFERVSLVGIPATIAATPLVVGALPGALLTLAVDAVSPTAAHFLAGGVDLLLWALEHGTLAAAAPQWASVWVSRSWLPPIALGIWLAPWLLIGPRRTRPSHVRARWTAVIAALLLWPVVMGVTRRGTLEIIVLDVGQGDAIALRSPKGRWILVDAGPPGRDADRGAHPVVRALTRRGVTRLEGLILTHPDLDHMGGAAAVLESFATGWVLDPGEAAGKRAYLDLLATAAREGTAWRSARAGDAFVFDGITLEVLAPAVESAGGDTDSNASSVVLRVRYGEFDALLTGDAPRAVERTFAEVFHGDLEVLKVGHHGSATSTDSVLLARAEPAVALVSVGRGNRYGHPSPEVLARLVRAGVPIRRTDLAGTLTVLARPDGRFEVSSERGPLGERR